MSEYQTPKKKLKFGDSTTPTSSPSSSNTSYTAYIQRVGEVQNSVSGTGNRYFDVNLQIGETDIQAIRVMIAANDTKRQTFVTKMNAQQPISLNNLRKLPNGMVFMHNGTVIKDVSPLSMPFQFVPAAAEPTVKVTDVLKKKQGDMVTVCGTVKWDSQSSKPENCNKNVRDGKLIDSSGAVDISIWGEQISTIEEGKFYKITNCKIRFFYGKKLSTTQESMITESEEQDISKSLTQPAQMSTVLCCPEIQNVTIDYHAICNNKNCKARIDNGGQSKVVRCTSCNRSMLIKNCYMDINVTLQLEKDNKQYTVTAHSRVLDLYFKEDISSYRNDQDSMIEKVLLLDNIDFKLSANGRFVVELKDHN